MSLTRGHSCVLCQQRKVRCDRKIAESLPCSNCTKAGAQCKVVAPQAPRRKKRKLQDQEAEERLKRYETLLTQNGIDFESIIYGGEQLQTAIPRDSLAGPSSPSNHEDKGPGHSKWHAYYDDYQTTEELLYGSSEDEHERPIIHRAFDTMFSDTDGFPFTVGGAPSRITHLHPSPIQIFQLWQIYIDNVNPLLKVSHVPTLQTHIIKAGTDLEKISKPLESFMFNMYLIAVTSVVDDDVQTTFGETKTTLLARYHKASQQSLVNAGFMRSNDLMSLQAFFLYLLATASYVDPRSLFCLIGIAVRVAIYLGLHRDGTKLGLSIFETEQRRRLWWQLVVLDKRISEITGSAVTALSSSRSDSRLPLNVNDTDLHPQTKNISTAAAGLTEMTFSLTRIEFTIATAPNSIRPNPLIFKAQYKDSNPSAATRDGITSLFHNIEEYCNHIESRYISHCDSRIPIQHFTLLTARISLHKLRLIDFICRRIPTSQLPGKERDALFLTAVQMVEYDNTIYTTESLRGFLWSIHYQAAMPGYTYLLSELQHRTTGELCERAWEALTKNHDHRGLIRKLDSPMHTAFGHSILRAWRAREKVLLQKEKIFHPPEIVNVLRRVFLSRGMTNDAITGHNPFSSATISEATNRNDSELGALDSMESPGMGSVEDAMFSNLDTMGQMFGLLGSDCNELEWSYMLPPGSFGDFYGEPYTTRSPGE